MAHGVELRGVATSHPVERRLAGVLYADVVGYRLMGRLDLHALAAAHIGKESNLLEQQEEGILDADPQAEYPGGGEWEALRPWLDDDRVSIRELSVGSGVSERMLRNLRKGDRCPSKKLIQLIASALGELLDEDESPS